jgi:hypothetical protein
MLGHLVEVHVARRQIGSRVGDRDLRLAAVQGIGGVAPAHPSPMDVGVAIVARVPLGAAEVVHRCASLDGPVLHWTGHYHSE